VECETVVEALLDQLREIGHRAGSVVLEELQHYLPLVRFHRYHWQVPLGRQPVGRMPPVGIGEWPQLPAADESLQPVLDRVDNLDRIGARLAPDVRFDPAAPEIGFVHRTTDSAEVYFLANTGNTPKSVKATFRATGLHTEVWDPMTGKVSVVIEQDEHGATRGVHN
jgi:hypothetical protein